MKTRILCLYLPSSHAGLRTLVQVHDTATLALREAPPGAATFDTLLIACGFSGGSPRVQSEQWNAGTAEMYLATPNGPAYTGTSLLTGEERAEKRVLYPWRQGVQPAGSAPATSLGQLPATLSEALRTSSLTGKAVLTELDGEALEDGIERASARFDGVWENGPSFVTGQSFRQTRGTARAKPEQDEQHLQAYAQSHLRTLLERDGYTWLEDGLTASSAVYTDPQGETIRAHLYASVGSAAVIPLSREERFWHQDHTSLLGVLRDVHQTGQACSGGQAYIVKHWTIDEKALQPVRFMHLPGEPTHTVDLD